MSSVKSLKLQNSIYTYLGYKNIKPTADIDCLIDECLKEIEQLNSFKYIYQEFSSIPDFLNKEPYSTFLKDCNGLYLVATTLGISVEKKIKQLQINNLQKSFIMDACASAYLEYQADLFEENLCSNRTYRFCPGYQGSSVSDIAPILKLLKSEQIGIELLPSGLMIPQKSMCGIVGIGKQIKKTCNGCIHTSECQFLKEGLKCYQI